MSKVISFRLNKENLREAKALMILQEWRVKGYSIRQIITDALLRLDQNEVKPDSNVFGDLNDTLCQVNRLLRLIEGGKDISAYIRPTNNVNNGLSASFVASVKKSAKSGLKLD